MPEVPSIDGANIDEVDALDEDAAEIGPETVRRVADELAVAERDSPALNEANRLLSFDGLVDGVEPKPGSVGWWKRGGDIVPRSSASLFWAAGHRVQGVECISPMWPQPLCCV
jgi:hypothetical protein